MKIRDAVGRTDGASGYARALGDEALGQLISRVQSTVISNGTELERIIVARTNPVLDLDVFIDQVTDGLQEPGIYLCQKKVLKKSRYAMPGIEPDLLIFLVQQRRICKVVELKDGDNFDTKKSQSERDHLEHFATVFGSQIPFVTEFYICCFNQEDKTKIQEGFKHRFELEHILTGRELCEVLDLDYDQILQGRQADMQDNFDYFVHQLLQIDTVREEVCRQLGLHT